jgi:hypothetical protein
MEKLTLKYQESYKIMSDYKEKDLDKFRTVIAFWCDEVQDA